MDDGTVAADHEAPAVRRPRRLARWSLRGGLVLAIVVVGGLGWQNAHPPHHDPVFCTADGYIDSQGTVYSRSNDKGCVWVDADDNPLPLKPDGTPDVP